MSSQRLIDFDRGYDGPHDEAWHSRRQAIIDAAEVQPSRRAPALKEVPRPADESALAPVAWRTLADIDDAPAGPLLLGMFEPDGPNLLYAPGGTGKGSTGAWGIRELDQLGIRSMIFDAENRPKEWARRCSGLGVDRSRVVYVQPKDLPPGLMGRPLWDIAPHLGNVARHAGVGYLWIDSILAAAGLREEALKSDAQAPYLYVAALDDLGIPSTSFGHPPRATPDGDPYGSVSWVNAMRLTWSGLQARGDAHVVRWTPRKRNERGHISGVLLTFIYGDDGRLSEVERDDDDQTTRDWIYLALHDGQPKSVRTLAEQWADEHEEPATEQNIERIRERLRKVLRRLKREGAASCAGAGNKQVWSLLFQGRQT
jgi:hypothetical protein